MNRFLETLNKLQDVFTTSGISCKDIDLPQIVVVGSQSTGKSSVLESLAKQNFLPRGMGIVTRRPLVLQMISELNPLVRDNETFCTWAKFLHSTEKVYTKMEEVSQEIIEDTNRVCGANKGISDKAIHLKVHSTQIPSLTLVDLPGLTKIPVGDQPRDIDRQIEALVRSYISKENSIILAVSAGNVDIANSDALKLAKEVDPTGARTLAVITKVDLMERNQESIDMLEGTTVVMNLGLIGVINRTNQMLQRNVPLEYVLKIEKDFFDMFCPAFADKMGTPYLSNRLCDILIGHLKKCLPALSDKISVQVEKHRGVLVDVGMESTDKGHAVISSINQFCEGIKMSMAGHLTYAKDPLALPEPGDAVPKTSAGSELFDVFENECCNKLASIPADKNLNNLRDDIRGAMGIQPSLFIPDGVFTTLISRQLDLFDGPCINAIEKAHRCFEGIFERIGGKTLSRYPSFEREVVGLAKEYLGEQVPKAKEFIKEYLNAERSYINTNHPQFIERYEIASALFGDGYGKSHNTNQNDPQVYYSTPVNAQSKLDQMMAKHTDGVGQNQHRSNKEAELMQKMLIQYFCITRDHLIDFLPKTIMRFFVQDIKDNLQNHLIKNLYKEERIESLIQECDTITRKRQSSSKMLEVLMKAESLVTDIKISNRSGPVE